MISSTIGRATPARRRLSSPRSISVDEAFKLKYAPDGSAASAAPTTGVVPAAADEVSALTAAQFAAHAQMYQAVSAQAAAIHEQFINTLGISSGSYAATGAANTAAAG